MKNTILIVLALFSLSFPLQSQDDKEPISTLYMNELHLGFFHFVNGTFHIEYERYISENKSFLISGELTLVKDDYREALGGQGEIQYRYYLMNRPFTGYHFGITGIYAAPYLFYGYLDQTEYEALYSDNQWHDEYGWYSKTGTGVLIGMKLSVTEQLMLDVGFGGGLRYLLNETQADRSGEITVFDQSYTGIAPRGNFTLGIKF
ncbi:MAG: DUF3575 domain-containing protein [Bacteroidales bacterium]